MAIKSNDAQYLDLSPLSIQARQELLSFYHYLLEHYQKQHQANKSLPEIFYNPIKTQPYQKFNRDDIYHAR